jgi:hypothetical protein
MRPPKAENEKLKHPVTVRLNDAELAAVEAYQRDHGPNPATQCRMALLKFLKAEGYLESTTKKTDARAGENSTGSTVVPRGSYSLETRTGSRGGGNAK